MIKRTFDGVGAAIGLLLMMPVFVLIAAAIKLDSPGPVLFRQVRVGRRFQPFRIYKFRTMRNGPPGAGQAITSQHDSRVTRVGRLLRRTKLDELPQLLNVLIGDMSFVGPRPEVPKYVELYRTEFAPILETRPGITDLASLEYRNEAAVIGNGPDAERRYVQQILPDKLRLSREYVRSASLRGDVTLIVRTVFRMFSLD
jgi:lipopolysaccharide/colanic/teichoic acid biosynthesis glycosyltransferase